MHSSGRGIQTSAQLREAFLRFFEDRDHMRVESASLVPADDPTLLFTNAGMVPFKDAFLGRRTPPHPRTTSAQKCVRAGGKHNDLEMVGATPRHHTFFEMMGNFSFGDYFKREAIGYAWEFLTEVLHLPVDRLWVSVYKKDDEAAEIWREVAPGVKNRLVRLGEKDNLWSMGDTGPCGPCSEIIYDRGPEHGCGEDCAIGVCDCDRWLEIWNLVFMQYDRDESGEMHELEHKGIDTGLGLERVASVLQGVDSNYDTDLFVPLIERVEEMSGRHYGGGDSREDFAFRVVADHIRSCVFLIADGVFPGNEGRDYVLRRILRRAYRFGSALGIEGAFLYRLAPEVVAIMGDAYPAIRRGLESIAGVIRREEERFASTLSAGMNHLEEMLADARDRGEEVLGAGQVFKLYDTFGFPPDLSEDVAAEWGLRVDRSGFEELMEEQRRRARAAREQNEGQGRELLSLVGDLDPTEFVGYRHLEVSARVVALIAGEQLVPSAEVDEEVVVFLDRTPFHAEGGGQVGDAGILRGPEGEVVIEDTRSLTGDVVAHFGRVESGRLRPEDVVVAQVDRSRRRDIARHHTATHLIHAALREVLGDHIAQAGSLVEPGRFRFDFAHPEPMHPDEIRRVEDRINEGVLSALPVTAVWMDRERALESDVVALFGDRYGETVRVVSVEGVSRELCGGTHVQNTGEIGMVKILSEESVGAGVRRLEGVAGRPALQWARDLEDSRLALAELLQVAPSEVPRRVEDLVESLRVLRRERERLEARLADRQAKELGDGAEKVEGIAVLAQRVEAPGPDRLREMADVLREEMGECAFLLAIGAATPEALSKGAHMGEVVRELGRLLGGGGGGRPDMAQAGGGRPDLLEDVLRRGKELIARQISEGGDPGE
ncbi:MAG: alanine--tRNA ligase [Bacillota bacterium]